MITLAINYIMYGTSLFFLYYLLDDVFNVDVYLNHNDSYLDVFIKNRENINKNINNKMSYLFTLFEQAKIFTNNNIKLLFFRNNDKINEEESNESVSVSEENNVVVKHEVRYENKYLEKIREMSDEYIFSEEEIMKQEKLFIDFLKDAQNRLINMKGNFKKELMECNQELADMENIEFSDDDKNITYDEDGDEIDPFEERIRQKKNFYKEEVERIEAELIVLNEKVIVEEEIKETARQHIINEKLDTLKNNFIIEKTPLGNVLMFYNNKKQTFEYYSDNSIPYRFLEVVSRKYVLTFKCRFLYIDMENELKKYETKMVEKEKEKETREKDAKEKEVQEKSILNNEVDTKTCKKNVFAKFKSYNKDAGSGRVNKAPPPKNSIPNNKANKKDDEKVLLKEKSNHYTCEGKFANFNMIKKIDRKIIDKKYSMTFADFKKNIINKK